ncbi:MAG TPA: hypothetical protein VIN59_02510 [Alphaproteobacteria bacterium]
MLIYGIPAKNQDLDDMIARLRDISDLALHDHDTLTAPAHLIEQGQVGFSATDPIGTKHVNDCVALVLHDPHSKKTAVAHIDIQTDPASIEALFDKMPTGQLQASLLGGRYRPGMDDPKMAERSMQNLRKVLDVLKDKDVNVASAHIQTGGKGQHQFWINPRTGEIAKQAMEHAYPDSSLAYAKMILTGGANSISLEETLDLTLSPDRKPVLLRKAEVDVLNNHIRDKTYHEISDWFVQDRKMTNDAGWISNCVAMAENWNNIYQNTLAETARALGKSADDLRGAPLYVGQNAMAANIEALVGDNKKPAHSAPVSKPKEL